MIRLTDGRICLTYRHRAEPHEIHARLSVDEGKTWSEDIVRRQAATWELGYTRTVEQVDGKIVTVYYYSEEQKKGRMIAATIWDPA